MEAPEWFGDPLAAYRRSEETITGVGVSGRATVCAKTVNTTALDGVFVVRSLTVSSIIALPPCVGIQGIVRSSELAKCFRRNDAAYVLNASSP